MTNEQLQNETMYQVCIAAFRQMEENGIIDQADYEQIQAILIAEYQPIFISSVAHNRLAMSQE